MTSIKEQERNLINLRRSKVSELLAKGHVNQAEIARTLNVSEPTICRDLKWFNECATETLSSFTQKKLPEEVFKALISYDSTIRIASSTADNTKDDKVRLQALDLVNKTYAAKLEIVNNTDLIKYVMDMPTNKDKGIKDTQQQPVEQSFEEVEQQEIQEEI